MWFINGNKNLTNNKEKKMKLYSLAPQDCSGKVKWLLLEMGIPFEEVKLNYKNGDLKTEEYLKKHPLGQVPVLEDGDLTMIESYAIVAYLADKYPDKKMAPEAKNLAERASYYQWLFFSRNSVEEFLTRNFRLPKMNDEYRKDWGQYIIDKTQLVLKALEKQLAGKDYILGNFSAVDVCLGYAIESEEALLNDFPAIKSYLKRLSERKACIESGIFTKN